MEKNSLNVKLAAPAHRALAGAGIKTLKDFTKFSEKEITELHGIGKNAMEEIKLALKKNKLSFKKK